MVTTVVLLVVALTTIMAQSETKEKFMVAGNCGMCKTRIEKAAKSVDGVSAAAWDKETKMVEVSFNADKTTLHQVHLAIAKAGHDTEMHKASDEVYDQLPGCCKYERIQNTAQN